MSMDKDKYYTENVKALGVIQRPVMQVKFRIYKLDRGLPVGFLLLRYSV